jgi:SAM-dependent methyltransferase
MFVFITGEAILLLKHRWGSMKVADSGMPEEDYWNSLFDIPLIIQWLNLESVSGPIVEAGCGYGTFTLPIAKEAKYPIYAFDIESEMIQRTEKHLQKAEIRNVHVIQRDIVDQGTGLESESAGLALLFNILHFAERRIMLEEACRILKPSGIVAIIHWRKDIPTPRGPALHLRPDRKIILDTISGMDLSVFENDRILKPYHWGIQLNKGKKNETRNH